MGNVVHFTQNIFTFQQIFLLPILGWVSLNVLVQIPVPHKCEIDPMTARLADKHGSHIISLFEKKLTVGNHDSHIVSLVGNSPL